MALTYKIQGNITSLLLNVKVITLVSIDVFENITLWNNALSTV